MRKFSYKILIFTIIIPILLISLFESACHVLNIPKISHNNIKSKSQDLIPKIDSNTILFLGDSRIEYGIKPEVVKKSLIKNKEIKIINLALPGSNGLDILNYLKINSIYPKTIIFGFTPNYGRYSNHSFDKTTYSNKNRIIENIKYFLGQTSFFYDTNSIKQYLKGEYPFFKSHEYDEWGGVTVINNGNYQKRKMIQYDIYKDWSISFNKEDLDNYYTLISQYKKWFAKEDSKIIGLYMPVSNELYEFEKDNYDRQYVLNIFNNDYYDYSTLYNTSTDADSLYFYDGSHLTPKTAITFSEDFTKDLNALMRDTK